jgi:hypothetical protein
MATMVSGRRREEMNGFVDHDHDVERGGGMCEGECMRVR